MVWNKNGTPDTLTVAGDTMTISDLLAEKFNVFLSHVGAITNFVNVELTFDNTGGNDYSFRRSINGAADSTTINLSRVDLDTANFLADTTYSSVIYCMNINNKEKLGIYFGINSSTAGVGNAPRRVEGVFKKDTSTDTAQFTRIDLNNTGSGDYTIGSNLSALGTD